MGIFLNEVKFMRPLTICNTSTKLLPYLLCYLLLLKDTLTDIIGLNLNVELKATASAAVFISDL